MRYKNLFWGIFFIVIGVLWFLNMKNIVVIYYSNIYSLWPLVLIWMGISIIPIKNGYKISMDLLVLALAIYILLAPNNYQHSTLSPIEKEQSKMLFEKKTDSVKISQTVDLSMSLYGGSFTIGPGSDIVNVFGKEKKAQKISIKHEIDDINSHSDIELNYHIFSSLANESNYKILLHLLPIWSINLDAGAAKCAFDLSDFKVRKININAGVTDVYIKLGALYSDVALTIATGVAIANIEVPSNMQCIVYDESGFTRLDLNDFNKQEKNKYISNNTNDESKGVIHINIQSGMSNVNIKRY